MATTGEIINGVVAEIEGRVAGVLSLDLTKIFEEPAVFANMDEPCAFVNAQIEEIRGLGICNDEAILTVSVGFAIADDGTHMRIQRVTAVTALRAALTWTATTGNPIANAGLPMVIDMSVSAPSDRTKRNVVEGGLIFRCSVKIEKGAA